MSHEVTSATGETSKQFLMGGNSWIEKKTKAEKKQKTKTGKSKEINCDKRCQDGRTEAAAVHWNKESTFSLLLSTLISTGLCPRAELEQKLLQSTQMGKEIKQYLEGMQRKGSGTCSDIYVYVFIIRGLEGATFSTYVSQPETSLCLSPLIPLVCVSSLSVW